MSKDRPADSCWYAIRTRPRHEKKSHDELAERGFELFLPLVDRWRRWKDRRKLVSFPLFPGYLFARFPLEERLPVLSARGVLGILGSADGPVAVPEAEIERVRRLTSSNLPYVPHPYLRDGTMVEVVRGPLEGVRGILLRKGRRSRLVISVHLIQQAASVDLDAADVEPVRRRPAPA